METKLFAATYKFKHPPRTTKNQDQVTLELFQQDHFIAQSSSFKALNPITMAEPTNTQHLSIHITSPSLTTQLTTQPRLQVIKKHLTIYCIISMIIALILLKTSKSSTTTSPPCRKTSLIADAGQQALCGHCSLQ